MGLDSTNRDDSFWDTIGTQTMTRDTIFRFGTQFRPFGTQSGTVFMALALADVNSADDYKRSIRRVD